MSGLPDSVTVLRDKESGQMSMLQEGRPWCPTASHEYATYDRRENALPECPPHDIEDISNGTTFVNVSQCRRCGVIQTLTPGEPFRLEGGLDDG